MAKIVDNNKRRMAVLCLSMIFLIVMAGFVPAIHVLFLGKGVDARHKAGHDSAHI